MSKNHQNRSYPWALLATSKFTLQADFGLNEAEHCLSATLPFGSPDSWASANAAASAKDKRFISTAFAMASARTLSVSSWSLARAIYSNSAENFKRLKNREDGSDLDENLTESIATTQTFI